MTHFCDGLLCGFARFVVIVVVYPVHDFGAAMGTCQDMVKALTLFQKSSDEKSLHQITLLCLQWKHSYILYHSPLSCG